jgi:hypothetical protein
LGLYLEDDRSHREFHSPANRFYEMLSAGLPMVFQPEAVLQMAVAGYDIAPYVAASGSDALNRALRQREAIGAAQRAAWCADYVGALKKRVKKCYKEISA